MKIQIRRIKEHYPAKATVINRLIRSGFKPAQGQSLFSIGFILSLNGFSVVVGAQVFICSHKIRPAVVKAVDGLMEVVFTYAS